MSGRQKPEDAAFFNEQEDLLLTEDIVHALDASVAQSVNRALAIALQPIARQLKRYALTVPPYGQPIPLSSKSQEKPPEARNGPTQHPWPFSPNLSLPPITSIRCNRPPAPRPFPTPPHTMPLTPPHPSQIQTSNRSLTNDADTPLTDSMALLPLKVQALCLL
ncbi:hypothetical protein NDU88_004717 [Pleurodeles waltl]|uniref:Uncharacterized protein n=1 Tax=Pleurodeles waltl TaxID=8319 RepID=A0AAV7QDS6_PLEWA|nr:hypothetical protein NDU88_004717 [Pleurodeles waltl]